MTMQLNSSTTVSQAELSTRQANAISTPFDEPLYSDLIEYSPDEMPRVLFEAVMRQSLERHQSTRSKQGGKRSC